LTIASFSLRNILINIENREEETSAPAAEEISTHVDEETKEESSNGLENFGIEEETPELFNSDNNEFEEIASDKRNEEEDDLEIPAFLRRQKN